MDKELYKELYGPHGHIKYLSSVNFNKNLLGEIQKRCKHNSVLRNCNYIYIMALHTGQRVVGVKGVVNKLLKQIKSIIYGLKLKYYLKLIQAEMILMSARGEPIPDNYIWKKLDKLLSKKHNEPERELNTNKLYIHNEDWN